MTLTLCALLVLAAPKPRVDDAGFIRSEMVEYPLLDSEKNISLKLNVALGFTSTLYFPKGVTFTEDSVQIGNAAIFDVTTKGNRILIRPLAPQGATGADLIDQRTNLQIEMRRGWRLSIELRQWYQDRSVKQVVFQNQAIEADVEVCQMMAEEARADERSKYEEKYLDLEADAESRSVEKMNLAVLERNSCNAWSLINMTDLLWVKQEKICVIGKTAYVQFRIRNRARGAEFKLGDVQIVTEESEFQSTNVVFTDERGEQIPFEKVSLRMNQEIVGSIAFAADQADNNLTLRITEAGGKRRVVEIEDIGF